LVEESCIVNVSTFAAIVFDEVNLN